MSRRRYSRRRRDADEGKVGLALLLMAGLYGAYLWLGTLPLAWQIAVGVIGFSVTLLFIWSVVAVIRRYRRKRLLRAELMSLSSTQFEERTKLLFADLGWRNLQLRGGSGDRGVDIDGEFEGKRYIIQCKRYTKNVTPAMVRDLVGTLHIQKADRAILITTSGYTKQGYQEAQGLPVELWDGAMLAEQIARAAELQADPVRVQALRRRRMAILGVAFLLNAGVVGWALFVAGSPLLPAGGI
ncbi:MAG: restriction endonuclease [Candidatus Viridilinea halotolerans]|uniref:Restriction endonuclease n=1 Tax=Candidatus Viridilinea halotolerans TaxID=2491704 RepID=A0A426TSI2_9CHLR|nr:MAG: restriction endonuclease [Candidatus Viridilinea halotolerans]